MLKGFVLKHLQNGFNRFRIEGAFDFGWRFETCSVVPREPTWTFEKWRVLAKVAKIVAASPDGSKTVSLRVWFP